MPQTSDVQHVQDRRRPPFCYQTHDALDLIRANFEGAKRPVALAIYLTFTESANRKGGAAARDGFRATRKEIARLAGVSPSTLDRYVAAFESMGLLEVVREKVGEVNLPNQWVILDCDSVHPLPSPAEGGSCTGEALRARSLPGSQEVTFEEPPVAPPPAVVVFSRARTVGRKPVTDAEYDLACRVLATFNAVFGTSYSSADWIAKIVMRCREHPELDVAGHGRVIRAAKRDPWWTGFASPSVVYGNAALFERCIHASDEEGVGAPPLTPEQMGGYGVTWGPGTPYASPRDIPDDAVVEGEAEEIHDGS